MAKSWRETEKECLKNLAQRGFWCHLFSNDIGGQPCDIVAIHKKGTMLLDVKHCDKERFELRRIEPNQWNCFLYAKDLGIECGFAIYCETIEKWKWLGFQYAVYLSKANTKSVNINDLTDFNEKVSSIVYAKDR